MARQNRKKYSCDFETTTDPLDCRVWAYGWMEIGNTKNYKIGNSIEDFMEWVKASKADLYFHNLKFDGSFIVNWLKNNGYEWRKKADEPNTFTTVISSMGQWYMIDICYGYTKPKSKKSKPEKLHTVIYDSLKKLPFPVKQIAKAFQLPILKGDIDYHTYRSVDHEITEEEHKYIHGDIYIVAEALRIQFSQGLSKMTNGSDSLNGFVQSIDRKNFKRLFPVFTVEFDRKLRDAYRGGFTWVNPRFQNKMIGKGKVYDVNSLYPAQMYSRPLPYGNPIPFEGEYEEDESFPLYIQALECEFHLKDDHIPTIQLKNTGRFMDNEYLSNSGGERVQLIVTNVDLELIKEHYELYDVRYINGWKFRQKVGMFKDFIDYWTHIKTTSDGAIKQLAKLMLNSLYGKFASNPDVTGKIPFLKEDGALGFTMPYERDENGEIVYEIHKGRPRKKVDREYKTPVYTPMGIFITSWARYTTITTAQKCFDRIIYCDTDSIHLTGWEVPEAIKDIIDDKKLGYWAHEGDFVRGKFLRQKTYLEQHTPNGKETEKVTLIINGKRIESVRYKDKLEMEYGYKEKTVTLRCPRPDVKCAGMPERIKQKVSFRNFKIGFTSNGKLTPKQVKGGVVLMDDYFTIR